MAALGEKLHGLYVYGSVATGQASSPASDLDLYAVLHEPADDVCRDVASRLSAGFADVVREVGISTVLLDDVRPDVLLLDEPSEGLAPVILQEIGRLLGRLKATGLSIVLAGQNHRFALRYADRGDLIEKGQIRHEAPAPELVGSEALQRYLGV